MALKLTSYYRGSNIPSDLPGSDVFHSTTLFHIYASTSGFNPVLVVASDDGVVLGKLLAVVQKIWRISPLFALRRGEAFGTGEYFCLPEQRAEIFSAMLREVTRYVHRLGAAVMEFRNLNRALDGFGVFKQNGYFAVNWMSVRNDLAAVGNIEDVMSKSRLRQLRRGLRNGAQVAEATSEEDVRAFALMLKENYRHKLQRHFPNVDFFRQIMQHMSAGNRSKIFITTFHGKVIGGCVCLYSGARKAYVWFSGAMNRTYLRQYPGILCVWKALTDAKERGYEELEFMDVGLPFRKHGYREFVLRFGGTQIGTRRWFRLRWGWLNNICQRLYS